MATGKRKRSSKSSFSSRKRRKYTFQKYVPRGRPTYTEKKGVDSVFSTTASSPNFNTNQIITDMTTSDFIFPVNLIQAGSGSWQRIGRRVHMHSFRLKGVATVVYPGSVSTPISTMDRILRVLIIYDRQPNKALPSKDDIISVKNQSGIEAGDFQGLLSYDNMNRFKILKDSEYILNPPRDGTVHTTSGTADGQTSISTSVIIDEYLKLNLPTTYAAESTPSVIGDISTGAVYVMFLTNIQSASSDYGNLGVRAIGRLRYTD